MRSGRWQQAEDVGSKRSGQILDLISEKVLSVDDGNRGAGEMREKERREKQISSEGEVRDLAAMGCESERGVGRNRAENGSASTGGSERGGDQIWSAASGFCFFFFFIV